jgi:uncharacterized protein YycO
MFQPFNFAISQKELVPGDLLLVKGYGLIATEIECISKSPYYHVAGVVKENELIEANGFRKTGYQALDYYSGVADIYRCPSLTNEQRAFIVDYVKKEVGSRYDYLLILWEAIRYMTNSLLPYIETQNRICSTLWADAYLAAGIDLCPGVKYPSPGDIAQSKSLMKISFL